MIKKIFSILLIALMFSSFIAPKFSLAEALMTTENLTTNSVVLKAENLTNNREVTFEIKNKYSSSPNYSQTFNTTTSNPQNNSSTIGSASVPFSGLTQKTAYTGKVYYKGTTQAEGTIDFTTVGDGMNFLMKDLTETSVTFVLSGLPKNKEVSFNVENYDYNTPTYTNPQDITTDDSGVALFQFYGLTPGGHYKYSHSEEPGKFGSFYTKASSSTGGGTNTTTTSTATGGPNVLVPCDNVTKNCGFNELFDLIQNVINFILFKMAVPIAAIMFAYAGFIMVTSGGSSEKKGAAKKTFLNVAIGLAFVAGAWLIVHTILTIAGYNQSINWFGL